ncbi:MAG: helix-turn-helix transcriptional regulator [Rhodospirillaceae bacterium]|nr:helix-turn-helix transcriptional regulator [Rhodospirillales bacterium]
MTETVGARMRRLRGTVSQDEYAAQLGVHKETIGKYERDKILPGADVLTRLRQDKQVDINWLLTGQGDRDVPARTSSADIDADALAGALTAVEELLHQRQAALTQDKKAKLVALVYKQLTRSGTGNKIEHSMLNDLLDLAS